MALPSPGSTGSPSFPRTRRWGQLGKLCVSIRGATPEQMQANAAALLPRFPFQELRLDTLTHPGDGLPALRGFLQEHTAATFLATCRPLRSGGQFAGTGPEELAILTAAARLGFRLVDLSLETAEELGPRALRELRSHGAAGVLVSVHDFQGTGDLEALLARLRVFSADLFKIVSTAHSLDDSLSVLHLLATHHEPLTPAVIAIAMGEPGVMTRVLGPRAGSAFTFAAPSEEEATAPGQLTAETLTDLYRVGELRDTARLFGVAGDPIQSSLSPVMLNTAFQHAAVKAVYLPLKTASAPELFRVAQRLPLEGFSVTMPLKQAVLPFLEHVDPLARRIGAVNTVHRRADGRYHGYNTDAAGIVAPLERRLPLRGSRVLVLGAGGAARAAVFSCVDRGAQVFVHNRTPAPALALAAQAGARVLAPGALRTERFDVLINATPAGMRGNALALPLREEELRATLVFDLVYNPLDTPLLTLARAHGLEVIAGVEMFLHQGAEQFALWTGAPAPLEVMRSAVLEALRRREQRR